MKNIQTNSQNPIIQKIQQNWLFIVGLVILIIYPRIFDSGFSITVASEMGIAIVFALSYNMLLGQGGMLSFGHAVVYGVGGFAAIHILNDMSEGLAIPLELLPLIGGFAGLAFGIISGYISTRKSGTTFALISMGIVELVAACSLLLPSFFGGEEGIDGDRMVDFTLTGFDFGSEIQVYYLIVFWTIICTVFMYLQTQTPIGRMANAVRDNPERALFVGYNTHLVRFFQFSISGFFAGVAGGLFAINYEMITPELVGSIPSGNILLMTYVGGVGHFFGPIIGACLFTVLRVFLSNMTEAWQLYLGLLFVGMVLWAPNGIAGLIMLHKPLWMVKRFKKLIPVYLMGFLATLWTFFGLIILVEINYHLSLSMDPSSPMSMIGVEFQAQSPIAWIVSLVIIISGVFLCRPTYRSIKSKWNELMAEIKEGK